MPVFISSNFNDSTKNFNINQKDNSKQEKKKLFKKATKDIVLGGQWILTGAIFTTLNLKEIS